MDSGLMLHIEYTPVGGTHVYLTPERFFDWKLKGINCATEDYSLGTVSQLVLTFETDYDGFTVSDRDDFFDALYVGGIVTGVWKVASVEKKKSTKNHYIVTCYPLSEYDYWDKVIPDSDLQPIQNETLLALAQRLGIQCYSPYDGWINSNYVTNPNWGYTGVTRRQVAQWIYQLAGVNYGGDRVYEWEDAPIVPNFFYPTNPTANPVTDYCLEFTPNNVKSIDKAEYTTPQIDRIWFGSDSSDVGLSYGSGTQQLSIPINPLINYDDTSFLQPLYNRVNALVPYTPMRIETFLSQSLVGKLQGNHYINVTSYYPLEYTIDNYFWMKYTENNVDYYCPIFNWEASPSGIIIEGTGSADRTTTNTYLSNEIANAGKYNKFQRTLDYTVSEVGNLSGEYSNLTQTVNGLTSTVVNKDGVISAINQSAETITINANRIEFNGVVTFNDLDSSTQNLINSKTDDQDVTQIIGGTVNANYINALDVNAKRITATYTKTFNHSDYSNSDLTTMQSLVVNKNWTASDIDRYDINMDGQITSSDILKVRNMIQNGTDETATIKTEIDPSKVNNPVAIYVGSNTTPYTYLNGSQIVAKGGHINNLQVNTIYGTYAQFSGAGGEIGITENSIGLSDGNGNWLGNAAFIQTGTTTTTTSYTMGGNSYSVIIDWDYIKYSTGDYECWGAGTFYIPNGCWNSGWAPIYTSYELPHVNYPVTFTSAPHERAQIAASNDWWGGWLSAGANANSNNTTTKSGRYQVVRGDNASSYSQTQYRIEYYVKGKVSV